jgi:hypothetical protein
VTPHPLLTLLLDYLKTLVYTKLMTIHFGRLSALHLFVLMQQGPELRLTLCYQELQLSTKKVRKICLLLISNAQMPFLGAANLLWPPVFGQRSVQWPAVFKLIQRPEFLWEVWKPSQTLDKMDLDSIWKCWTIGEEVVDKETGEVTGMKPPIALVEQEFRGAWRKSGSVSPIIFC